MDARTETAAPVEDPTTSSGVELLSLKDGRAFIVANHNGDITGGAEGLFHHDTRILSHFIFLVGDRRPWRLSSTLSKDNAVFTFHGANRALPPMATLSLAG